MANWLLKGVSNQRAAKRDTELYNSLLRHESKIGGTVFGPVPAGHAREFFCLDERTWVWHEEWTDQTGQRRIQTTRYDIRPKMVVKSQNGVYSEVGGRELRHLKQAVKEYLKRVNHELYLGVMPS